MVRTGRKAAAAGWKGLAGRQWRPQDGKGWPKDSSGRRMERAGRKTAAAAGWKGLAERQWRLTNGKGGPESGSRMRRFVWRGK